MKMNKLPDGEYLKTVFDYMDGALIGRVRPANHFRDERTWRFWNVRFSGKRCGRVMPSTPYRQVMVDGVRYLEHRIIAAMFGIDTNFVIDHIDGNGLNNMVSNLRSATQQQNTCNNSGWRKKESRVGVWQKDNGRWIAYIRSNGKQQHLGTFINYDDAVNARVAQEVMQRGEFSFQNRINHIPLHDKNI